MTKFNANVASKINACNILKTHTYIIYANSNARRNLYVNEETTADTHLWLFL